MNHPTILLFAALLSIASAPAQADVHVDPARVLLPRTDADRAPVLVDADRAVVLRASAGDFFVVLASADHGADADRAFPAPAVVLASGRVGAGGDAVLPMPVLDARTGPIALALRAVVTRDGIRFAATPVLPVRLLPSCAAGDADRAEPVLKLTSELPPNHPVRAVLVSTDGIPPEWTAGVEVDAPTTGYALRHAGTRSEHGCTRVFFELRFPDPALRHLTVIETLQASAHLGAVSGTVEVIVRAAPHEKREPAQAAGAMR